MAGVTFTRSAAKRIADAVKRVEQTPMDMAGAVAEPVAASDLFWVEITGNYDSSTGYPWKMKIRQNGQLVDRSPSITGNRAFDPNGGTSFTSGTKVILEFAGYDGTNPRYLIVGAPAALPKPTGLYQGLQCVNYVGPSNYTLAFDWVRAH